MLGTNYGTICNTDCIIVEEDSVLNIIPKESEDIKKLRSLFDDQRFFLRYHGAVGHNAIAYVEQVEFQMGHAVKAFPKYIVNRFHTELFAGFELTGEVIDDFFSPVGYFFERPKRGEKNNTDVLYNKEVADRWDVCFEEQPITITLSYGDILSNGIASDLKLHPKLTIEFEPTMDTQFVHRVYCFVVRFLCLVRYNIKCGKLRVHLFNRNEGRLSYNGYMRDFSMVQDVVWPGNDQVEYSCYKPYIHRFLQFAADNPQYTFYHYPSEGLRFRGNHYSAIDYMNIFAAFESECHARSDLYENADSSKVQAIKDALVERVEAYPKGGLTREETDFLNNARNRIMQLGTQYGQSRKIINAYDVLHKALDSSIENIFYLPESRLKEHLAAKELREIAKFLTDQRGAVAHGGFSGAFSDVDAQKIRFLEILTYAQLLKRVGLDDTDVERVIGVVFGCNYVLFQEKYS